MSTSSWGFWVTLHDVHGVEMARDVWSDGRATFDVLRAGVAAAVRTGPGETLVCRVAPVQLHAGMTLTLTAGVVNTTFTTPQDSPYHPQDATPEEYKP